MNNVASFFKAFECTTNYTGHDIRDFQDKAYAICFIIIKIMIIIWHRKPKNF